MGLWLMTRFPFNQTLINPFNIYHCSGLYLHWTLMSIVTIRLEKSQSSNGKLDWCYTGLSRSLQCRTRGSPGWRPGVYLPPSCGLRSQQWALAGGVWIWQSPSFTWSSVSSARLLGFNVQRGPNATQKLCRGTTGQDRLLHQSMQLNKYVTCSTIICHCDPKTHFEFYIV